MGHEPSLIYTSAPVASPGKNVKPENIHVGRYHWLTAYERWHYLSWLQDIRLPIPIRYVFLYYCGLERRLLTGDYGIAFEEIQLLRDYHKDDTFLRFSSAALFFSSVQFDNQSNIRRLLPLDWSTPHISLYLAHLTQSSLSASDMMMLPRTITGMSQASTKDAAGPVAIATATALQNVLTTEFGDPSFPIHTKYDLTQIDLGKADAYVNGSFPERQRLVPFPDILNHSPFCSDVARLFQLARDVTNRVRMNKKPTSTGNDAAFAARPSVQPTPFIESRDHLGKTPLIKAATHALVEVVKRLCESGASPNLIDSYGRTALIHAVQRSRATANDQLSNYQETVRLLLAHGADIEIADSKGRTPLLLAVIDGNPAMVAILVGHGADLESKDMAGTSPMDCAISTWNLDVLAALSQSGVQIPSVEQLCADLSSDNVSIGVRARNALLGMRNSVVPNLLEVWLGSSQRARRRASYALHCIQDPRAFEVYLDALCGEDVKMRAWAAQLLHLSEDARIIEPFMSLVNCPDTYVRQCALEVMARLGDERAVPVLCEILKDEWCKVRGYAVDALRRIGDRRAVLPLCDILTHHSLAQQAVEALREFADPISTVPLLHALHDGEYGVRIFAHATIIRIGRDAIPYLEDSLSTLNRDTKLLAKSLLKELRTATSCEPASPDIVATTRLLVPECNIDIADPDLSDIECAVRRSFTERGQATTLVVDEKSNLFVQNSGSHIEYNLYNDGAIYAVDGIDVDTAVKVYLAYVKGDETWKTTLTWRLYLQVVNGQYQKVSNGD